MDDGDGTMAVGLTSYLPFANENVCFFSHLHVITYNKVHSEIEKFYFLSCHFTKRRDDSRLNDINATNLHMSDLILNESVAEDSANGAIQIQGTMSIN